ncbi:EF2563 family selenium-dependent molybdenum hydroxylase system protein [bacterium]|nr:EF2563 family selenium-dependent molybdenum hydroxylase system protein [bacterium]
MKKSLRELNICIKGAGEMASGIACRLYAANIRRIVMLEIPEPMAIRQKVSFCQAVNQGEQTIENITAVRTQNRHDILAAWNDHKISIRVDPLWNTIDEISFDVVIDAILAKKNLGTHKKEAPLVIGMGPGFEANVDSHVVIETHRGHSLGKAIYSGTADKDTGIPSDINGYSDERVIKSPVEGVFQTEKSIGDLVKTGESIGTVGSENIMAKIDGVIRGLLTAGITVSKDTKMADIDPRGNISYCDTISDKARALGGAVLEVIMSKYNC